MAETKTINLDIETNLGSLKSQLREAQAAVAELSDKFGVTSKEAAEAAKRAAELKDRIEDAKALTDAFNPDAKFNALSRSIGGALDGFQAFEGALGLIGVESEDLQKTLLKVQSAMSLSQGIQGVMEAKDSFIQLGAVVKNAFSGMTTAAKAFAVTGVGLLITALGLIAANWDKISGNTDEAVKKQKAYQEGAKKQAEFIGSESKEFATLISRLKATNQGTKERSDLIKKINTGYGTTLKNLKDEAAFQRQANEELASYLEYQKAKYKLQANEDLIQKNLEKQSKIQQEIVNSEKEQQKLRESLEKAGGSKYTAAALTKSIAAQAEYQKRLNDELKEAEKRFENYGAAAQKAQVKVDDITESGTKYVEQTKELVDGQELAKLREYNREATDLFKSEYEKQVRDIREKYAEQIALAKKYKQDTTALEAAQTQELEDALDKSMKSLETLSLQKVQIQQRDLGTLQGSINQELKLKQEAADLELLQLQVKAQRARKIEEQSQSFKVKAVQDGLSAIASITELFGKKSEKAAKRAFQVQKAANMASALISTYQNATAAYASQFTPLPTPDSPIRGGIVAGIAVATGLANVAKIAQQKFESPSTGGGGGSTGSAGGGVMSPNFNIVGNSGFNQLAQIQQQPIQAYVVSGEVTSAQALDRNRIKNATL